MTRFQLSLRAERLPRGLFHTPRPYAEVQVSGGPHEGLNVGTTKPLQGSDVEWTELFYIDTDSSIFMPLRIVVSDDRGWDKRNPVLAQVTFEATEVFQSVGQMKYEKVDSGAIIYAQLEESIKGDRTGHVTMHLRGLDIKNIEPGLLGLGRSDPFFEIAKKHADHAAGVVSWTLVYRSEHIFNHLNPFWQPFDLDLEKMCYCDENWPLRITVKDWQQKGSHRVIGSFETTLAGLMQHISIRGNADRERAFEIVPEQSMAPNGLLVVLKAEIMS